MICPDCGKENLKNLGVHRRFCTGSANGIIVDNHIKEKRLSDLITELRSILDRHRHSLEVKTFEEAGDGYVQITAKIPIRR
jgi:hypothetical protein